jgi:hypothetical protein
MHSQFSCLIWMDFTPIKSNHTTLPRDIETCTAVLAHAGSTDTVYAQGDRFNIRMTFQVKTRLHSTRYLKRKLVAIAARLLRAEVKKRDRQSQCLIYRRPHGSDHLIFIIIIPTPFNFFKRSLHRNHLPSYFVNIHIERLSHNENNSYPFIRPPKASIAAAAFTPPKALHINRNSPQKTTNYRPKPRTLPPLSKPPLPRAIRTSISHVVANLPTS